MAITRLSASGSKHDQRIMIHSLFLKLDLSTFVLAIGIKEIENTDL